MRSNYFAPLVPLPVIIDEPGAYVTRKGECVTVDFIGRVSTEHAFSCFGNYSGGVCETWHKSGRLHASTETENDIIRKVV